MIERCSSMSASAGGSESAAARRPRDACWRAVASGTPRISPISANGTENASCSTKATRCSGVSLSSTTMAASRTCSSRTTVSSGSSLVGTPYGVTMGSGSHGPT